jgi:Flp pilus assembly protein TadD
MTENVEELYKRAKSEMKKGRWLPAIKLLKHRLVVAEENWQFSGDLGWCYFKLDKFEEARKHMIRATRLAPENPACTFALGVIYLEKKHFKKAEVVLTESLTNKESHVTRVCLALAYLSQGKVEEAESVHLEGIRLKPKSSRGYEGYAVFLSDVGRKTEARIMKEKACKLRSVN